MNKRIQKVGLLHRLSRLAGTLPQDPVASASADGHFKLIGPMSVAATFTLPEIGKRPICMSLMGTAQPAAAKSRYENEPHLVLPDPFREFQEIGCSSPKKWMHAVPFSITHFRCYQIPHQISSLKHATGCKKKRCSPMQDWIHRPITLHDKGRNLYSRSGFEF